MWRGSTGSPDVIVVPTFDIDMFLYFNLFQIFVLLLLLFADCISLAFINREFVVCWRVLTNFAIKVVYFALKPLNVRC